MAGVVVFWKNCSLFTIINFLTQGVFYHEALLISAYA
jgi:hypothetical protein